MTKELLSDALSLLDDKYLTEAIAYEPRKKRGPWLSISAIAACLVLLLGVALLQSGELGVEESGDGPYELMMNGQIYKYAGIGRYVSLGDDRVIHVNSPSTAYLPEGYAEYGPAVTVKHRPESDGEVAGWSGTIYVSDTTPEAVYLYTEVISAAYHTSTPHYVRFISEVLYEGQNMIRWQGADYRMTEEVLDALPDDVGELGVLHCVGWDALPQRDLETNCITYDGSRLADGCTVYSGDGKIYVQIAVWRDGGEQPAYQVWEK